MTFQSLPLEIRRLEATEARLQAVYEAAKLGLKGDNLALAAGMLPVEFRRLCQMDPLVEMAEQKGRADAEQEMSTVLYNAARAGDAKMALEVLRHRHDWQAAQKIDLSVSQQISVITALEQAEKRVIDMQLQEKLEPTLADAHILSER